MVSEIINFREFRSRLSDYINKALNAGAVLVKSKNREVVLISLDEYRQLTGDETDYLLSSKANRKHLEESIQQFDEGKTVKVDLEDLWK
ncbi:MAG: type II toxin-antitoxin system Phd/YefM family antitoxin [Cyclobacteriaceae bacterium]